VPLSIAFRVPHLRSRRAARGYPRAPAAWDFAAEVLHFHAPERYPLMTRWVWDETTQSGALRELVVVPRNG